MKVQDLNTKNILGTTQFLLFNTETNWYTIHHRKVYKISRALDDLFYMYEKKEVEWGTVARRLRFLTNDPKNSPVCTIDEFELEEDIDVVYADGEILEGK